MRLLFIQFAYFFNGIMERPDQRYVSINSRLNNLFNGYPTILPYSPGMPIEFPIVQLKSNDGKYLLNMAKSRCDFIISYPLSKNIQTEIDQYYTLLNNLTTELSTMKFSRVGMVARYIIEDVNGVKYVNDKFFKKNLENMFELMIRFNERKKWNNTLLNDVINISNIAYNENNTKKNGVHIERDINTAPDLLLNISKKEIDFFVSETKKYFTEASIMEILK